MAYEEIDVDRRRFRIYEYGSVIPLYDELADEDDFESELVWKPICHIGREEIETYIKVLNIALEKRKKFEEAQK